MLVPTRLLVAALFAVAAFLVTRGVWLKLRAEYEVRVERRREQLVVRRGRGRRRLYVAGALVLAAALVTALAEAHPWWLPPLVSALLAFVDAFFVRPERVVASAGLGELCIAHRRWPLAEVRAIEPGAMDQGRLRVAVTRAGGEVDEVAIDAGEPESARAAVAALDAELRQTTTYRT